MTPTILNGFCSCLLFERIAGFPVIVYGDAVSVVAMFTALLGVTANVTLLSWK